MSRILRGETSNKLDERPQGHYFHTEKYGFGRVYSVPNPDPNKKFMGAVHVEFTDQDALTVQEQHLNLIPDYRMGDPAFTIYAINGALAKIKRASSS
jgi:hypothetical protein